MNRILPEIRRGLLKKSLDCKKFITVVETVNGLEALAVNTAENSCGRQFDALWFSGLCCAAFKGKPDNEYVDMTEKIKDIEDIFAVTDKPLIVDMDTGGKTDHLCRHLKILEAMGVSAVVIEDKTGEKRNSLYGEPALHTMEEPDTFAEKIMISKSSLQSDSFMIFARIESFIAGEEIDTALIRADKYLEAGADGIVIHSVKKDGGDAFAFASEFKRRYPDTPLMMIPTAFDSFTAGQLSENGADIIIYANHLMRSAYQAMITASVSILENGKTDKISCTPVSEILSAIENE